MHFLHYSVYFIISIIEPNLTLTLNFFTRKNQIKGNQGIYLQDKLREQLKAMLGKVFLRAQKVN